jgi:hypothetical protein
MKTQITAQLGLLGLAATLAAGCSTNRITDYRPPSPSATERTAQQAGVEIAVDPFVQSGRTKQYFAMDAVGSGIAILHVRVANRTSDQTFLVEKKHFQLVSRAAGVNMAADGNTPGSSTKGKGTETTAVVLYGVGSPVLGVGFLLAGAAASSHAEEVQRNFVSKEMADQTLSPGQTMEGFIYFSPVTKGEDWSRTMGVKVDLTNTKTRQTTEVAIPL